MKSLVMAFVLVLVMSASSFAAGAYTVFEVRPYGSELAIVVNRTSDNAKIVALLADDANKKYFLSVFLTALSTGKSVDVSVANIAGKWCYSMVRLYNE